MVSTWGFFWRRPPRNFVKVKLVARWTEHFWGVWAFFLLPHSLQKGCVLIHKNSLTSCLLVSTQRRVTRSNVSFQTK